MSEQLKLFDTPPEKKNSSERWVLFTDGASRGNPGPSGAGIYIELNGKGVVAESGFLGKKTNNQAEYLALALGIYFLKNKLKNTNSSVEIVSDSELLIKQMKGEYKVKDKTLFKLKGVILSLLENLECSFTHVLRISNKKADKLANIAIDKISKIPKEFIATLNEHDYLL